MSKKTTKWLVVALFLMVVTAVFATSRLSKGTIVWAEWTQNSWYHGEIAESCEKGWFIHFDDGDKKCCEAINIAADEAPEAEELEKGAAIIAEWTDKRYYPGIISAINGESYDIQFDDGDKLTVDISKIRIRGN